MTNPLLARFVGVPSLVAPEMKDRFEACLRVVMSDPKVPEILRESAAADDGFWPEANSWRSYYRPYVVVDGVLQIPVKGVLLHDFSLAYGSFATGYVYIRRALERGLADATVKGIAFLCDSPGGEVAGNFDLVDVIYAARGTKPIRAFAHEAAYSAAYSIASAADRIWVARTGGVGSIGVVTSHVDASKAIDAAGLKITFIHAGAHKVDGNPYEPLPEAVQQRIQTRIDGLYDVFVATVARNRGLKQKAVRATEALCFSADEAIANGLADAVGSLEDAVAAFVAELNPAGQDETMITQEAHDAAVATARTEGRTEGEAAGRTAGEAAGAATAKTRIKAILGSDEAKGRGELAEHLAFDSDLSAEASVAMLGKAAKAAAPEAAKSNLAGDMSRETAVDLGADQGARASEMSDAEAGAASARALIGKR